MVAILVVMVFTAFIFADILVQWAEARRLRAQPVPCALPASRPVPLALERIAVPPGLFLGTGHTWLGLEPSGMARIGMDEFASRILGHIDTVELPGTGKAVRHGEGLFTIRQGDRTAVFTAPVDGVVTSVNEGLRKATEPLGAEPYTLGWICTLKPANLAANLRRLLVGEDSRAWIADEIERFMAMLAMRPVSSPALGALSPDGGDLVKGVLEKADKETWDIFVGEFIGPAPSSRVPEDNH